MDSASNFNATRSRLLPEQLGSRAVSQAQTPMPEDHAERYSETKAPWPSTVEYQPRWSSTGHPPSPLSEASAPEGSPHFTVKVQELEDSVSIHIAPSHDSGEAGPFAAVPATRSTTFADLRRQQQLAGVADFLDIADLCSLAQTSRANNGFVTITFPTLTDLSPQHNQLTLGAGQLRSYRRWNTATALLGGTLTITGVVTLVAAAYTSARQGAFYAQAFTGIGLELAAFISCLRVSQLSSNHRRATQEFNATLRAFENDRETRRALAGQLAHAANASTDSWTPPDEPPPTEAINTTPPSSP